MKVFPYILSVLIFTMVSCKTKIKSPNNTLVIVDKSLIEKTSFTKILSGSHSNILDKKNIIIKSQEDLESIYSTINSTRSPNHKIPEIDFTKNYVLGLFMGSKTSGGFDVMVSSVVKNEKDITIYYVNISPSGMVTNVITHPFYLASIPKTDKPIKFVSTEN